MRSRSKTLFWIFALLAALSFDQLFWEKPGGINFFIFILLALLGGLIPIWLERIPIPWTSYVLLAPIGYFAVMTAFRADPFTSLINALITLGVVVLFTITLLNGAWFRFNVRDHLVNICKFILNCFAGGILFFVRTKKEGDDPSVEPDEAQMADASKPARNKHKFLPVLRGTLLALPILVVLTLLLASADPVFSSRLRNLFSIFDLDRLGETLFRLVYIVVLAYLLLGAYFFGSVESKAGGPESPEKPLIHPFLGLVESGIILSAVNLLFALFVSLQFTYLFGGTTNIHLEGFTYAEYARRGFFELLAVGVISLTLFYALSNITRRETSAQRRLFSGLGLLLVGLVGLILASAYTRLTLYEAAYGFTRLRTLTHIFIIWTGLLLLAVAVLEVTRSLKRVPLVLILFIIGFGVTLNILNLDRFIVTQNIARSLETTSDEVETELDTGYLHSLSYDSIPPLISFYNRAEAPDPLKDELGGILACRLAALDSPQDIPWSSWHASRTRAVELLQNSTESLADFPVIEKQGELFVEINGRTMSCSGYRAPEMFDD